jgi:uncharacterized protein (TIGR02145 family)
MKNIFYLRLFAIGLVGTIAFIVNSCSKLEDETEIKKERVSGFVQKGPFINGTQILMSELNSDLEQTGNIFSTQIVSNTGAFEINDIALSSNYVEFSASGFYFDEVKGEASAAQLTLFALSDITDITSVNVNILTHLERRRVEYLIGQNMSFAQAKQTAQSEILAMFGFENSEMEDSENLNITINEEGNAILLAISVIIQGNRSVADLTELLAGISGDLREDGELSDESILENLRNSSLQLNLPEIRQNLESRYTALGIEANIPDFESYVAAFLSYTAGEPFASTQNAIDITTTGATLTGFVNPNSASTQVIFEYGLTNEYGTEVTADQSPVNGNMGLPVKVTIGSLDPATTYHFRVKAINEHGEFVGQNRSFTTLGEASDAVTNPATNINLTSSTINGRVNPNHLSTTVVFEYGATTDLGSEITAIQSPVSGHNEVDVSADIEDLQPGTTYFFRVKAENDLGISYANILEFKTLGDKPTAIANHAQALETTATLFGTVNPNLLTTLVSFEWGTGGAFQHSVASIPGQIEGGDYLIVSAGISGLTANTEYQFRVKAENSVGTTYSDEVAFKTYNGTVTDIDGNVYPTIIIGEQEWMVENLKTTRYRNGTAIEYPGTDDPAWQNNTTGAYAWYDNDIAWKESYGALYNWHAVNNVNGLCPTGWHVPSDAEWTELVDYLVAQGYPNEWDNPNGAGNALKSCRQVSSPLGEGCTTSEHPRWKESNKYGTDEFGFSALPGGLRYINSHYDDLGHFGYWWSNSQYDATRAWYRALGYYLSHVIRDGDNDITKEYGFSIRCVRDID